MKEYEYFADWGLWHAAHSLGGGGPNCITRNSGVPVIGQAGVHWSHKVNGSSVFGLKSVGMSIALFMELLLPHREQWYDCAEDRGC
jgi:hypothetical protein